MVGLLLVGRFIPLGGSRSPKMSVSSAFWPRQRQAECGVCQEIVHRGHKALIRSAHSFDSLVRLGTFHELRHSALLLEEKVYDMTDVLESLKQNTRILLA